MHLLLIKINPKVSTRVVDILLATRKKKKSQQVFVQHVLLLVFPLKSVQLRNPTWCSLLLQSNFTLSHLTDRCASQGEILKAHNKIDNEIST